MTRTRPVVSFALPQDVIEMIAELAEITGWSRSKCVEECVRYAFPEIKKRFTAIKSRREEEEAVDEEEKLREEYWRKVITGQIKADEWEQLWWAI